MGNPDWRGGKRELLLSGGEFIDAAGCSTTLPAYFALFLQGTCGDFTRHSWSSSAIRKTEMRVDPGMEELLST